jgi:hypothetical protein
LSCILQIKNLPEALAKPPEAPPVSWNRKAEFWKKSFNSFASLAPKKDAALQFISRASKEIEDRHFGAHAIWDEFVAGASEPTVLARTINAPKGEADLVQIRDVLVSVTMLRGALGNANRLNVEACEFSTFLNSLRPPPSNSCKL